MDTYFYPNFGPVRIKRENCLFDVVKYGKIAKNGEVGLRYYLV
jgi:hypothetical protein